MDASFPQLLYSRPSIHPLESRRLHGVIYSHAVLFTSISWAGLLLLRMLLLLILLLLHHHPLPPNVFSSSDLFASDLLYGWLVNNINDDLT